MSCSSESRRGLSFATDWYMDSKIHWGSGKSGLAMCGAAVVKEQMPRYAYRLPDCEECLAMHQPDSKDRQIVAIARNRMNN